MFDVNFITGVEDSCTTEIGEVIYLKADKNLLNYLGLNYPTADYCTVEIELWDMTIRVSPTEVTVEDNCECTTDYDWNDIVDDCERLELLNMITMFI